MATCEQKTPLTSLDLPNEFEDLTGILQTDLKVIVATLAQRASERLLLTRRESQHLRRHPLEQPGAGDQRSGRAALGRPPLIGLLAGPAPSPPFPRSNPQWRASSWA